MKTFNGRPIYTKEEIERLYSYLKLYHQIQLDDLKETLSTGKVHGNKLNELVSLLLDSSLISQTKDKHYTHKIVQCGRYYQVYSFADIKTKKDQNLEKMRKFNPNLYEVDTDDLSKKESREDEKEILLKNIQRSKLQMERIVKTNEQIFKTFITLTFKENETDITTANKAFNSFRTYIKKIKPDFKYVAVPEFQKRGAVHYHVLSNIDYTDFKLLSKEEKRLWNRSSRSWQIGRNIKGWNKGYSLVKNCSNIINPNTGDKVNVVGYMAKYMTKDIDKRLWGKRRFLYSLSLDRPSIIYIDESIEKEQSKLNMIELLLNKRYENYYFDKLGVMINFEEYEVLE